MTIDLLPIHEQTATQLAMTDCQLSEAGHRWIDVTKLMDIGRFYECARCGAKGHDPDFKDIDWS